MRSYLCRWIRDFFHQRWATAFAVWGVPSTGEGNTPVLSHLLKKETKMRPVFDKPYRVEVRERVHGDCVQKARFDSLANARSYERACGTGEGYFTVVLLTDDNGWDIVIPPSWQEDADDV